MKYYLIVGEASGDLHASHLMSIVESFRTKNVCMLHGVTSS